MIRTGSLLSVMFLFLLGTAWAIPTAPWAAPANNPAGPWTEVLSMPALPSNSAVSDGGGLALMPGRGLVYAIKGNRTGDFYSYSPATGAWMILARVPDGPALKQVKTGGGIAADDVHNVYVVKGNNTVECYRYSVDTLAWRRIQDVPLGDSRRKVKAGDMVGVPVAGGTDCYFLKAIANEFYRYTTVDAAWHQLSMPQSSVPTKWDKGSFLVYDGNHTIYAHKAKYDELWAYNTWTDSWGTTPLPGIPFVSRSGRSKKSKDGACGVFYNGCIYALKGGNTQEFWRYDPASRAWVEMETIPRYGSSGTGKFVKAGGDMVLANNVFYALKGSKTRELWKYTPADVRLPAAESQSAAAGSAFDMKQPSLAITPNPLASGLVHLAVGGTSLSRPAMVRLYDAAGRCVGAWKPLLRNGAADLNLRQLTAGVYLVRVEADGFTATQKLVVQR